LLYWCFVLQSPVLQQIVLQQMVLQKMILQKLDKVEAGYPCMPMALPFILVFHDQCQHQGVTTLSSLRTTSSEFRMIPKLVLSNTL